MLKTEVRATSDTFARKLFEYGRLVIVLAPYRWPVDSFDEHMHDPARERKLHHGMSRGAETNASDRFTSLRRFRIRGTMRRARESLPMLPVTPAGRPYRARRFLRRSFR